MNDLNQHSFLISGIQVAPELNLIGEQRVEPKVMEVLLVLVGNRNNVVSKEKILDRVWPDTYVSGEVVSRAVSELRKVFDDDPKSPTVIETIPKKGYRLIAQVEDTAPQKKRSYRLSTSPVISGIVAAVIFISIIGGIVFFSPGDSGESDVKQRVLPLTSYPGEEQDPALSPDGSRLAFTWTGGESGSQNVYVKLLNSEQPLQLTDSRLYEFSPAWSPDGSRIAYARYFDGIFTVPSLGGPEEKLTHIGRTSQPEIDWSPDGSHIVFSDRAGESEPYRIYLLDLDTRKRTRLTDVTGTKGEDHYPRFSPDGSTIAFVRGNQYSNDLYLYSLSDNTITRITEDNLDIEGLTWKRDNKSILFSSNRNGTYGIWEINIETKNIIPQNTGAGSLTQPTLSRQSLDGSSDYLAFIRTDEDTNIWSIDLQSQNSALQKVNVSTSHDRNPRFSPDGFRLVFVSDRSGSPEIWIEDRKKDQLRKLTSIGGNYISNPAWSPDGTKLVFDMRIEGRSDLFVSNIDNNAVSRLTENNVEDLFPRFSADGNSVYFTSNRNGSWQIWRRDLERHTTSQITTSGGYVVEESADGGFLYMTKLNDSGLWKFNLASGYETKLFELSGIHRANWALTSEGIYYLSYHNRSPVLRFYSFESDSSRIIRELDQSGIWYQAGVTFSEYYKELLYTRLDRKDQDIMAIENY